MYTLVIVTVALLIRLIIGYIFYGSIDVSAFISINEHTFNNTLVNHPFTIWCAFPVIPFYLWLSGFMSIKTTLPIAFCFKIIPIIFDSLLALLVYDVVQKTRPAQAFFCGLLYALSPVAIIITCIHGQWDAMPMFFFFLSLFVRDYYPGSYVRYFLYGLLFACSLLLKPIPLVFLPFFFIPWPYLKLTLGRLWPIIIALCITAGVLLIGSFIFFKCVTTYSIDTGVLLLQSFLSYKLFIALGCGVGALVCATLLYKPWQHYSLQFQQYLGRQCAAIAGLVVMMALCFFCLWLYGFNLFRVIDKVLRYFNQGIAVFGLPFGYPFNQGILHTVLKNRFWMMGIIAGIAMLYYQLKIDIYNAVLASLMVIFSFSGLSPQYLMWAVPLFLIAGLYRCAALFSAICTWFFLLYYMNPFSNAEIPYQSMLSFAPLKGFGWLLPSSSLTDQSLLPIIHLLGNYIIPLLCFSIFIFLMIQAMIGKRAIFMHAPTRLLSEKNHAVYWSFWLGLSGCIAFLMWVSDQTNFDVLFKNVVRNKESLYEVHTVGSYISGRYGSWTPCNIVFILGEIALIWSVSVYIMGRRDDHS